MPPYFAVLREHGVAHVFNSWTRMPPVGEQAELPGAFSAAFVVARILLRPGRYYAEAVDEFAPYDRIRDPNPELRRDVARLIEQARRLRVPAYILVNNRAEGSAPRTIAAIARLLSTNSSGSGGDSRVDFRPPGDGLATAGAVALRRLGQVVGRAGQHEGPRRGVGRGDTDLDPATERGPLSQQERAADSLVEHPGLLRLRQFQHDRHRPAGRRTSRAG